MCSSPPKIPAPPPPPPPPQLAHAPDVKAVVADVGSANVAQGGGGVTTTLLTGGQGDPIAAGTLAKEDFVRRVECQKK